MNTPSRPDVLAYERPRRRGPIVLTWTTAAIALLYLAVCLLTCGYITFSLLRT